MIKKLKSLWLRIKWWWTGGVLSSKLSDYGSDTRSEAEQAVERIVLATDIVPDCVAATTLRGGAAILITHDKAQEGFIGRSYEHAADKAIEWLTKREGRYIVQRNSTSLSQKSVKIFNAKRKKSRRKKNMH